MGLLTRGQKSLKLLGVLYNESEHNILALVGKANKLQKLNCSIYLLYTRRLHTRFVVGLAYQGKDIVFRFIVEYP